MKVIILNYVGCYVEVSDVPTDIEKKLDNGEISDIEAIYLMGYQRTDDSHWMFTDNEIPVFWKDEIAPYTYL